MSINRLIKAAAAAPPTPCVKFDCVYAGGCAASLLACSAFAKYVRTGRPSNPRMDFPASELVSGRPVMCKKPYPTREIFIAIENDTWGHSKSESVVQEARHKSADDVVQSAIDMRSDQGLGGLEYWSRASVDRAETHLRRNAEQQDVQG